MEPVELEETLDYLDPEEDPVSLEMLVNKVCAELLEFREVQVLLENVELRDVPDEMAKLELLV